MGLERHAVMDPADVLAMARGARIGEVMPDVRALLTQQEKALRRKVFHKLSTNDLSLQEAWNFWAEVHAMEKLRQGLDKAVVEAQSIGQELQTQVEDEDDG